MKIKRFFAQDMRQAIRLVREEHGPDAVILSTRRAEGGIEIISAIDFDQDTVHAMAGVAPEPAPAPWEFSLDEEDDRLPAMAGARADEAPTSLAELTARREAAPARLEAPARPEKEVVWSQDPAIVAMRQELESMRGLLQDQLSQLAWGDYARKHPLKAQLLRRLSRLGLATPLAREVAEGLAGVTDPDEAWRLALAQLVRRTPVTDDTLLAHGGVVALVGPTGVGKTTTIAKLAARFVQRHGRGHVALVSTDSYRIGAQKQLMTFGQILGVETHNVNSPEELDGVLRRLAGKKLVLIDTAGMSQRDVRLAQQFGSIAANPLIRTYLVMSANTERAVMEETVAAFRQVRIDGMVITKIDEAVTLGASLSVAIGNGLPIAYVSDGQRVPEDLHPARADRLVKRAVHLTQVHRKAEALRAGRDAAPNLDKNTSKHTNNRRNGAHARI
ncbi:MAG: flagellar biosynthesis protein FlhF [Gammaproteobacteria bacterium]|nr:flagellar biosynthesis protein FlhF [Gammaproteobacteria bacterium]MDX5374323.1 flagellar biosynthesis protein FlhF [Gammaproteobacteria bacterium]